MRVILVAVVPLLFSALLMIAANGLLGTLLAVAAVLGAAIVGLVLAAFVVLLFVAGVTRLLAGFVARRS